MTYTPTIKSLKIGCWLEILFGSFSVTGQLVETDVSNGRDGCLTIKDMEKNRVIVPINEANRFIIRVLDYLPKDVSEYVAKYSEKKGVLIKGGAGDKPKPQAEEDDAMPAARLAKLQKRRQEK